LLDRFDLIWFDGRGCVDETVRMKWNEKRIDEKENPDCENVMRLFNFCVLYHFCVRDGVKVWKENGK
jgi:hypothetical protein